MADWYPGDRVPGDGDDHEATCPECGHWLDADCYCPCCVAAAWALEEGND